MILKYHPRLIFQQARSITKPESLKGVIESIDSKYEVISSFDKDGGHTFDPALDGMGYNDLHYFASGYGYWIKMTENEVLELEGPNLMSEACMNLEEGWNLTGYWGDTAKYDLPEPPIIPLPEGVIWQYIRKV